jgi:hypothetical protein
MRRAVALLVLFALSSQSYAESLEESAAEPQMYRVEHAELNLGVHPNGNADVVHVGPGFYLSESAAVLIAKKLEGDKAEIASLKATLEATPPPSAPTWLLVSAITLGVLLGGASVALLRK